MPKVCGRRPRSPGCLQNRAAGSVWSKEKAERRLQPVRKIPSLYNNACAGARMRETCILCGEVGKNKRNSMKINENMVFSCGEKTGEQWGNGGEAWGNDGKYRYKIIINKDKIIYLYIFIFIVVFITIIEAAACFRSRCLSFGLLVFGRLRRPMVPGVSRLRPWLIRRLPLSVGVVGRKTGRP